MWYLLQVLQGKCYCTAVSEALGNVYLLFSLLWQIHTNADCKTKLLNPGAFRVLEWELELGYLLHEAIFTGDCMGGFTYSFWDWLVCSPFFIGSCISLIKTSCMYRALLNILSNLWANLTTKYYPLSPVVSCQGSRSLPVASLAILTFSCGVFCFTKKSSDPEILDFIILDTSEVSPEKNMGISALCYRK